MTDTTAHPSSRRYPPEIKERAVRLVVETIERSGEQGAVSRVAHQLGIGVESLRAWVRQAEVDRGTRAGLTSEERARMRELERENRELRRANEILKERGGLLRGGARPPLLEMSRYIEAHRATFGVEPICQVLAVAPSSYYAGRSRAPSARTLRDAELKLAISRVHAANFGVYGVRKFWRGLIREGVPIGRDRVGPLVRLDRTVQMAATMTGDLPTDRRGRPAGAASDRAQRDALRQAARDLLPLGYRQHP